MLSLIQKLAVANRRTTYSYSSNVSNREAARAIGAGSFFSSTSNFFTEIFPIFVRNDASILKIIRVYSYLLYQNKENTSMVKLLSKSIREYRRATIATPILVALEVVMECIMPFLIAQLVNQINAGCGLDVIVRYGVLLIVMAGLAQFQQHIIDVIHDFGHGYSSL